MTDTAEPLENPPAGGRPSTFTQEIADFICEQMTVGKGLREICNREDMPGRTTVLRWLSDSEEFRGQYARARIHLMDWYAEEIVRIAYDETGDIFIDQDGDRSKTVANHAKVQRDKLKIEALKWIMSKLAPRRYGNSPDELPLADEHPTTKIELVGVAAPIQFSWEKIERVIVDPKNPDAQPAQEPQEPRQITYTPPPPAELSPDAWSLMLDVLNLIEANTPAGCDAPPEAVLGAIKDALISLSVQ